MGNNQSKQILILGLENAGKSTLLKCLEGQQSLMTIPTIGFQQKRIDFMSRNINLIEIGGSIQLRTTWKTYYKNTIGIIFVVDSNDQRRLNEAQAELEILMQDLQNIPILIMANKGDLPSALNADEITSRLALHNYQTTFSIQSVSCMNNINVDESIKWIVEKAYKITLPTILSYDKK